jgi:hypothetical protein
MAATIIEIKPHKGGWQVFECEGVEPYFREREHALNYASERAKMRTGEIRVVNGAGQVAETIPFEGDARLKL